MECFLKKIVEGRADEDVHSYFVRYGKGSYNRRFLIRLTKGKKIKVRASFEFADDFVKFVRENKDVKFSGTVLSKDKVSELDGKKKAGYFVYEVSESSLEEFENPYHFLVNVDDEEIVLKIKKKLPKPGKSENKIDDKFCSLDVDVKYWDALKDVFFWDVPECKKVEIEHKLDIREIIMPPGEEDPIKIRELAKRKGVIVRKINCDGKESEKEFEFEA